MLFRSYAVKIIDLTGEKDNEWQMNEIRDQTRKEITILRMCAQHSHIINLHDSFESSTYIFLVLEMCCKGELFDYLTEVVTLSEKRTRQIMRQLLEAVEYCHSMNIVHRDLKPENILLDDTMNVKLSDFGFATILSEGDELTDLCGTPGYLAPEVLKVSMYEDAQGYGRAVDMWALGVIMYTLLVGCPPFWHRKQMYMLRNIMEGKYSFSSPEWEDVSEHPKDLISRFLVVDPEKRITAKDALAHPFFKREEREARKFYPRRLFKAAVITVIAMNKIRLLRLNPPPISLENVRKDPYGIKTFRKIIDAGAFRIYGHWVKRGENQNRAALFENSPKSELKGHERQNTLQVLEFEVKGRVGRQPLKLIIGDSESFDMN